MNKKVFVFEDNRAHYNELRNKLIDADYEVIAQEELLEAIDEARITDYVLDVIKKNWDKGLRLIICDLKIDNFDNFRGLDLIKSIRSNDFLIPECPTFSMLIPIIVWTGEATDDVIIDSMRLGANDYGYKPLFSPSTGRDNRGNEENWRAFRKKVNDQVECFENRLSHILSVPNAIRSGLEEFKKRYKGETTAFIMTSFAKEHKEMANKVRDTLKKCGITGLIADAPGGENSEILWNNIKVFMHGCDFGIGLYADDSIVFNKEKEENGERIIRINSNLSMEVGYMLGLQKKVYILKHEKLPKINSDLAEYIYVSFNKESLEQAIIDLLKTKGHYSINCVN